MSRHEPWAADFVALKCATERRVAPLALLDESTKETLMTRLTRRPLFALGILLTLLCASGAAYAVVTESWRFFLDADQPDDAMDRQVKAQANDLGARAEVDVRRREDGDVRVGMTWKNLKDILADCQDEHGGARPYELTVNRRGAARTTALDEEKHGRLMAVLKEASALSDRLAGDDDAAESHAAVLSFLEEHLRALGIEIADAGDDAGARIAAMEQGVNAWFGPDAPFEFHVTSGSR